MYGTVLFFATGILLIPTCSGGTVTSENTCSLADNVLTMTTTSLTWDDDATFIFPIINSGDFRVLTVDSLGNEGGVICSGNASSTSCSSSGCMMMHTYDAATTVHVFQFSSSVNVMTGNFLNNGCGGNIEIDSNQAIQWNATWGFQFRTAGFAQATDPAPLKISCSDDANTGTNTAGNTDDQPVILNSTNIEDASKLQTISGLLQVTRSGSPLGAGDTVSVTDSIQLRATLTVPDMRKDVSVWGAYYVNCDVGATESSLTSVGGTRIRLIGSDGCSASALIGSGFTQTSYNDGPPYKQVSETEAFNPFSFVNTQNEIWFICRFHVCTGKFQGSEKCLNICSTNTNRKKRQANPEDQFQMKTFVRLRRDETGSTISPNHDGKIEPQASAEEPKPMDIVVVATASAIGCLFVLVLFVACVVFCTFRHRLERVRKEKYKTVPSPSSSVSSVSSYSTPAPF